jgi:hypothetical protein
LNDDKWELVLGPIFIGLGLCVIRLAPAQAAPIWWVTSAFGILLGAWLAVDGLVRVVHTRRNTVPNPLWGEWLPVVGEGLVVLLLLGVFIVGPLLAIFFGLWNTDSPNSASQDYYYCWDSGPALPHHLGHLASGDHLCTNQELVDAGIWSPDPSPTAR